MCIRDSTRSASYMFILRADEGQAIEDIHLPEFDPIKVQYLAYQVERGPDGGRLHLQACVGFKKPTRVALASAVLNMPFNRANRTSFRMMHGTPQQAVAYCTSARYCSQCHKGCGHRVTLPSDCIECVCGGSTDKGAQDEIPASFQGSLKFKITHSQCVALASSGTSMRDLLQTQPDYVAQNIRFVSTVLSTICPPRRMAPIVTYVHGAAGSGKSRFAADVCNASQTFFTWSSTWYDGMHSNIMHLVPVSYTHLTLPTIYSV